MQELQERHLSEIKILLHLVKKRGAMTVTGGSQKELRACFKRMETPLVCSQCALLGHAVVWFSIQILQHGLHALIANFQSCASFTHI